MRAASKPSSFDHVAPAVRVGAKLAIAVAVLVPLAGCGTSDRMRTSSIPNDDYRARHPVLLANDTTSIDVFPVGSQTLDNHVFKQISAFVEDYRQAGRGPITILLPAGPGNGDGHAMAASLRRAFASTGVRAPLDITSYRADDPDIVSPIRISFVGLKAKVASQCGQWPSDIGPGATVGEWQNKPYYNFGCSTQSMIAAQAADPRDLVTPRGEEASDTQIRTRGIASIRGGTDPSTSWSVHNSSIGSVGGS